MEILTEQLTVKAPPETFTGDAWYDVIAEGEAPSRIRVNVVRFTEVRPGDTIHTPPCEWHWHGAAPDHFTAHFAIREAPEQGPETERGDQISDDEYRQR